MYSKKKKWDVQVTTLVIRWSGYWCYQLTSFFAGTPQVRSRLDWSPRINRDARKLARLNICVIKKQY